MIGLLLRVDWQLAVSEFFVDGMLIFEQHSEC